ncbi:isoleucine--tRNA ligase [Phycisphaerales bacterium AB-hyl4]|uniref:Isoleucine--tRNA ligase n=1 Tax=Natronomicrosphaera hydrolytica TaxID=3242702 RepID=A0ABV4U9C3_9BACT
MSQQADNRTYKKTLNLPKTGFSMKANLVQNEPASLKRWEEAELYRTLRDKPHPLGRFVFHDGPPYANGSIHLGHLLNKVMKDFVVRSRTMAGFDCPYVPGWDCHGLPIEHKVVQDLGEKAREMAPMQIRQRCKQYAEKFVKLQAKQMQRLLTLANYEQPYLTMNTAYEAGVLEAFADLVSRGVVYRGLKPVHWSIDNQTALAEAELEYEDREDTSVFVMFEADHDSWQENHLPVPTDVLPADRIHLMIWTTTPWTLPANLAVAVNERFEYGLYNVTFNGKLQSVVVATSLAEKVLGQVVGAENVDEPIATFTGDLMLGLEYRHPFAQDEHVRRVVGAEYVTLEDGTGMVHTAPGHGVEDYQTGLREKLPIYCPVLPDGTFDDTAPSWLRGQRVWEANETVVEHLRESGHLFHDHKFRHSYPHDWRGKTPVIFRATEQWFIAVDKAFAVHEKAGNGKNDTQTSLRERALNVTANEVEFMPAWGRNRMRGMLESRPDWCVSRQRAWGLPIPAFYNADGEVLLTAASVRAVAEVIRQKGSDAWFQLEANELLATYHPDIDPDAPAWAKSEIRNPKSEIRKGHDIFDVWFESGTSWHAVLRQRHLGYPADLYLEGSDQHRGWFQSSLLPSLGATGHSPFRTVLTHGFMVDKDGKKMSKSLGNTLEVEELLKTYGADVCRWWVSSLNTDNDIKVDESFFKLAGEEYRKVRNTIRFLLSNLSDFDPKTDARPMTDADATSIDAWALEELAKLVTSVRDSYEGYQFRRVHERLFHFCNDTLSAVYLTAVKDRLYCDKPDAPRRRRTQTALHQIADGIVRLLAPLMPHTADEAWHALHGDDAESVHLAKLPEPRPVVVNSNWPKVIEARDGWLRAMENARQRMDIDNPLDLGLAIGVSEQAESFAKVFAPADLADLCGVSRVELREDTAGVEVLDLRSEPRCERSWKRDGSVKQRSDGGMLSDRDAEAVGVA